MFPRNTVGRCLRNANFDLVWLLSPRMGRGGILISQHFSQPHSELVHCDTLEVPRTASDKVGANCEYALSRHRVLQRNVSVWCAICCCIFLPQNI